MMAWILIVATLLVAGAILLYLYFRKILARSRRFEAELKHSQEALYLMRAEREELAALMSHDLKGPFNRLFALVQLFSFSQENLNDEQRDYLSRMHQVSADGLGMIKNLLDYRRLSISELKFQPEQLDFAILVATLLKQYRLLGERKRIAIGAKGDRVSVVTDKTLMTRILDNLVSNAVKFSPEEKQVAISWESSGGSLTVKVQDQGPGFLPEELPLSFKPFARYSAKPTAGESTNGLGLHVTYKMVERMGGTIICESSAEGALFSVTIPVQVN